MVSKHTSIFALGLIILVAAPVIYWGLFERETSLISEVVEPANSISDEVTFTPHKALYDIKLSSKKSGSQIVNISGQMYYEWQETCDAWTTNHRFNMLYEYADTPALQITSDFTTYETFDGKTLNFSSNRKKDGELFESLRGVADTNKGEAVFSIPEGLKHELPEGVFFPMGHTLEVAKRIAKGEKFFKATIYDGSDEDGPVEVNTFIGKPANAMANLEGQDTANIDTALVNTPARKVRLAFFPANSDESGSDYEMDLVFHENGVISDMFIEYDDFSVEQHIVAVEKLERQCE